MEKLKKYQTIIRSLLKEFAEENAGDHVLADDDTHHYIIPAFIPADARQLAGYAV